MGKIEKPAAKALFFSIFATIKTPCWYIVTSMPKRRMCFSSSFEWIKISRRREFFIDIVCQILNSIHLSEDHLVVLELAYLSCTNFLFDMYSTQMHQKSTYVVLAYRRRAQPTGYLVIYFNKLPAKQKKTRKKIEHKHNNKYPHTHTYIEKSKRKHLKRTIQISVNLRVNEGNKKRYKT